MSYAPGRYDSKCDLGIFLSAKVLPPITRQPKRAQYNILLFLAGSDIKEYLDLHLTSVSSRPPAQFTLKCKLF